MAQRVPANGMYLNRSTYIDPENSNSRHYGFSRQLLRRGNMPQFGPKSKFCYLCSKKMMQEGLDEHLKKAHYGSRYTVHTITAGEIMLWRMLVEMGVCDEGFAVQCRRVAQRCAELASNNIQAKNSMEETPILNISSIERECDAFFAQQWEQRLNTPDV